MTTVRADWLTGRETRSRRRGNTFLSTLILTTLGVFLQAFIGLPGFEPQTAHAASPAHSAPAQAPHPGCDNLTCLIQRSQELCPIGRCGDPPPLAPLPSDDEVGLGRANREAVEEYNNWPPPRKPRQNDRGGEQWAEGWCGAFDPCGQILVSLPLISLQLTETITGGRLRPPSPALST